MKRTSNSGFNLVEMAIALVIVAIGIMSIVGMFPSQLDAVKKTADRAQMGQFAQSIEGVLRGLGAAGVDYTLPMPSIPADTILLPANGGGMWATPGTTNPAQIKLDNSQNKIHFIDSADFNLVNQSMWYKINVQQLSDLDGNRVTIDIWPGDQAVAPPPTVLPVGRFITEIYEY